MRPAAGASERHGAVAAAAEPVQPPSKSTVPPSLGITPGALTSGAMASFSDPSAWDLIAAAGTDVASLSVAAGAGAAILPRLLRALGLRLLPDAESKLPARFVSTVHSCRGAAVGAWVLWDVFVRRRHEVDDDLVTSTVMRHAVFEVTYYCVDTALHLAPLLASAARPRGPSAKGSGSVKPRVPRVRWDQLAHHAACVCGFATYLAVGPRFRNGPAASLTALLLLQHASTPLLHVSWLMGAARGGAEAAAAAAAKATRAAGRRPAPAAPSAVERLMASCRGPLTAVLAIVFVAVRVLGWPVLLGAYGWARSSRPDLPAPRWWCYASSAAMLALNLVWVRAGVRKIVAAAPEGSGPKTD